MKDPIVLASASPRRKDMFDELGIPVEVVAANIDESQMPGESPGDYAMRLAGEKGLSVATELSASGRRPFVVSADTVVVHEDTILGKPLDDGDARRMLQLLSGRTHRVITGYAIGKHEGGWQVSCCETMVTFYQLDNRDIDAYVGSGECNDKAGAYAIQGKGGLLVERIEGSFANVVGLPIEIVVRELVELSAIDGYFI